MSVVTIFIWLDKRYIYHVSNYAPFQIMLHLLTLFPILTKQCYTFQLPDVLWPAIWGTDTIVMTCHVQLPSAPRSPATQPIQTHRRTPSAARITFPSMWTESRRNLLQMLTHDRYYLMLFYFIGYHRSLFDFITLL